MTDEFALLTDEQIDQRLQELLKAAQMKNYQPTDQEQATRQLARQRIAKNRLITAIMKSGKLSKQGNWRGMANFEDLYNEALQQTFIEFLKKLDSYDSKYSVMARVNQIFNWRFQDIVSKYEKQGITQIPKQQKPLKQEITQISKQQKLPRVRSLYELTIEISTQEDVSETEQLKKVIEEDPDKYLRQVTIEGNPQSSLQIILLMRLDGAKWEEIGEELDVQWSTAYSLYFRDKKKIIEYLKKYIHLKAN